MITEQLKPVALLGTGRLATALEDRVRSVPVDGMRPLAGQLAGRAALLVVSDAWDPRPYEAAHEASGIAEVPWLPVRTELGQAVVGPFGEPGVTGCFACAETRRTRVRAEAAAHRRLRTRFGDELARTPSQWLHSLAVQTIVELVVDELSAPTRRTGRAVLHVALDTLVVSRHSFLPEPGCRSCGRLPDDSADLAQLKPAPSPKPDPRRLRVRDLTESAANLEAVYVDAEYGLVPGIETNIVSAIPRAKAYLRGRDHPDQAGYGHTTDFRSARITALAEALERHAARPAGKRTVVRGSFAELGDRALDPRACGLYPDDWYGRPDFPYLPFTEDLVLDWVWGYSFRRAEPVLVPESFAYYNVRDRTKPQLAYEISSGCALGGCLAEAIFHALLELAERDAFMLTWLARMRVPEIDLGSVQDVRTRLLAEQIEGVAGYRVRAFGIAVEQRIPCFWVMAVDPGGAGDRPAAICAAGSHPHAETALRRALLELAQAVMPIVAGYPSVRDHAERMAQDSSLVRNMEDHQRLYCHPSTLDRFGFLLDGGEARPFSTFTNPWPEHADLTGDLAELVSRFTGGDLDVVVVDQTTPELATGELSCVKVIVPGLVPMTFGHRLRRVHGLPRLLEIPHRLGYRDRVLTPDELNPYPHPFI